MHVSPDEMVAWRCFRSPSEVVDGPQGERVELALRRGDRALTATLEYGREQPPEPELVAFAAMRKALATRSAPST